MPETNQVEPFRYHLQPGYIFTTSDPSLVTAVVGTCVAVCLWDRRRKFGGVNHFLFPRAPRRGKTTAHYGNVAVPALIRMMIRQGSRLEDIEAQIFGGGCRDLSDRNNIGRQNVKVARRILKKKGIPVLSEDVGGVMGRRVVFHTRTNETIIMKTRKIRGGDWHPYRTRALAN